MYLAGDWHNTMTGVLFHFPQRVRTQEPCVRWQFVGHEVFNTGPSGPSRAESYVSLPDKVQYIHNRENKYSVKYLSSAVSSQK